MHISGLWVETRAQKVPQIGFKPMRNDSVTTAPLTVGSCVNQEMNYLIAIQKETVLRSDRKHILNVFLLRF